MSRRVGPKPYNNLSHHEAALCSGSALMTTLLSSRSVDSARVSANVGMSVENRVALRELLPVGG
jgi:hypothetical protein